MPVPRVPHGLLLAEDAALAGWLVYPCHVFSTVSIFLAEGTVLGAEDNQALRGERVESLKLRGKEHLGGIHMAVEARRRCQ